MPPHAIVLQVRSSAGLYGADKLVLALNGELVHLDVDSCLLSINNYLMDQQPLHEAALAQAQPALLLPCRSRLDTGTIKALRKEIRHRKAGILHVHDYKSAFYALLASFRLPVRIVATLHGWVDNSLRMRLYNWVEMTLLRHVDALVVVAESQIKRLLGAGLPRARIHRIDNGIDILPPGPAPATLRRADLGIPDDARLFAAVGRLSPEKNLGQLLDAFALHLAASPGSVLLLVGDGAERNALHAQARRLGVARQVVFTGVREDVQHIYPLLDCLVMPSLSEGMPLVILEAMSHGIPIVASAVGEIPRLLAHAPTSKIVPVNDLAALHAALDAAAQARHGRDETAREYLRRHHSIEVMASRYADIYRTLMAAADGQ